MSSRRFDQLRKKATDGEEAAYPSARYFQVHFQHLHQLIESLKEQVQEANRQLAEIKQSRPDKLPEVLATKPITLDAKAKPKGRQPRLNGGNGGL